VKHILQHVAEVCQSKCNFKCIS